MFEENLFRSDRNLCLGLRFSLTISQSTGQKLQIDGIGKKEGCVIVCLIVKLMERMIQ